MSSLLIAISIVVGACSGNTTGTTVTQPPVVCDESWVEQANSVLPETDVAYDERCVVGTFNIRDDNNTSPWACAPTKIALQYYTSNVKVAEAQSDFYGDRIEAELYDPHGNSIFTAFYTRHTEDARLSPVVAFYYRAYDGTTEVDLRIDYVGEPDEGMFAYEEGLVFEPGFPAYTSNSAFADYFAPEETFDVCHHTIFLQEGENIRFPTQEELSSLPQVNYCQFTMLQRRNDGYVTFRGRVDSWNPETWISRQESVPTEEDGVLVQEDKYTTFYDNPVVHKRIVYSYDEQGQIVKTEYHNVTADGVEVESYEIHSYVPSGDVTVAYFYDDGTEYFRQKKDSTGHLLEQWSLYNVWGVPQEKELYEYSLEGLLLRREVYKRGVQPYETDPPTFPSTPVERTTWTYDERDRVIEEQRVYTEEYPYFSGTYTTETRYICD